MNDIDFEDGFFNDEECSEEMEDILAELEETSFEGEEVGPTNDKKGFDNELLSFDEVFIVGSLFGQAYSEKNERHRVLKKKNK